MERERGSRQLEQPPDSSPQPSALPRLVGEARAAEGLTRMAIAERINDLLIAMRKPGNEAAEAKAILAELDVSALNGLVDGHGRDCRKVAVETLLECGFPHALEVSPEDLAHARKPSRRRRPPPDLVDEELSQQQQKLAQETSFAAILGMGAGIGQLGAGIVALFEAPSRPLNAVVAMAGALLVGGGGRMLYKLRKPELIWIPGLLMLVGAAAGIPAAFAAQNPFLATAAIIGGAMVMVKLKAKPED